MTITKEGSIASFYTVNKAPIKHLRVYFSPKQAGSGDPSPSNIREISGWNNITLNHCGKNLFYFDENNMQILFNNSGNQRWGYEFPIEYTDKEMIISAIKKEEDTQTNFNINLARYNKNNANSVRADVLLGQSGTTYNINFNPNNASGGSKPALISSYNSDGDTAKTATIDKIKHYNIQCELGTTVTEYEAYKGTTQTIDWSSTLGTIYGGYIDLITGELVKTKEYKLLNNPNKWIVETTYSNVDYMYDVYLQRQQYESSLTGLLCSCFPIVVYENRTYGRWRTSSSGCFGIKIHNNESLDDIKQLSQEGKIAITYDIVPVTYQLTPQQLQTFIGRNNIWSNADRVEVEYDLAESNDELYKRRNIILNSAPHLVSASSDIITFNTDMKAPLQECKVNFNPAQDRYATPSPTNVKTISGWTELQVQKNNDLILIIPDNFTTGQLGTSNGVINYLGNNTYEFIGTVEDGGSIAIPITPITFIANTTYYVKAIKEPINGIGSADTALNIAFKNSNNKNIFVFRPNSAGWSNYTSEAYLTPVENIEAVSLVIGIPAGSTSFKFRFFLSTSSFSITTINWASTLGAIPGGYLDLATGKLVQTHYKVTFDGTESITSSYAAANDQFIRVSFMSSSTPKIPLSLKYGQQNLASCKYSHGKYEMSNTIDVSKGGAALNTTGNATVINLHLPIELHTSANVSTDIKNYLATQYNNGTPVELCYELKDPIEYQLTPQQIKTLKGINNIWSNANGAVDIKYWTH